MRARRMCQPQMSIVSPESPESPSEAGLPEDGLLRGPAGSEIPVWCNEVVSVVSGSASHFQKTPRK